MHTCMEHVNLIVFAILISRICVDPLYVVLVGKRTRRAARRNCFMARPTVCWSPKPSTSDGWSVTICQSGKKCWLAKNMSVGKDMTILSNCWSAKKSRSGMTFANWTFGDRQGRSAIPFPDQLSVSESGFPNQLVCWGSCAVVQCVIRILNKFPNKWCNRIHLIFQIYFLQNLIHFMSRNEGV